MNNYAHAIENLERLTRIEDIFKSTKIQRDILVEVAKRSPSTFSRACEEVLGKPDLLAKECAELVKGERKVEAIKKCREATGKSLKDAKEWVESLV